MTKQRRRSSVPFSAKGVWWDPLKPDDRVAGIFTWYPNGGGEVELLGCLTTADGGPDNDWRGDCLYGLAEGDEYILLGGAAMAFNLQSPGIITQRIRAFSGVIVGHGLPDTGGPDDWRFDRVIVEVDFLSELLQRPPLKPTLEWESEKSVSAVTYEYRPPPDLVAVMVDQTVRVTTEWRTGGTGARRSASVTETCLLSVEVATPVSIHELLSKYIARLRDLVTFAAQHPAAIRSVRVSGPATIRQVGDGPRRPMPVEFLSAYLPEPVPEAEVEPLRYALIGIPDDDRHFRRLLRKWFEIYDQLDQVLALRFAAEYATFTYAESRFLSAVQALEALHRRLLAGPPDPEVVAARDAAIAACPVEHREWLTRVLEYAHEPSMRTRLREVLTLIGAGLEPLVGSGGKFIQRVVTHRNSLTHWDPEAPSTTGGDLHHLTMVLNFVIDAALLRLLDFSAEEVRDLLTPNEMFQHVAKQAR